MRALDASATPFAADPRFTGAASGVHLAATEDPRLHAYVVAFEPGARTAWHSHERGQLLICTEGTGYVGTRDGRVLELRSGGAVWTDPLEEHWHGAGPGSPMSHVAVQTEEPGRDGVDWLEPVAEHIFEEATR